MHLYRLIFMNAFTTQQINDIIDHGISFSIIFHRPHTMVRIRIRIRVVKNSGCSIHVLMRNAHIVFYGIRISSKVHRDLTRHTRLRPIVHTAFMHAVTLHPCIPTKQMVAGMLSVFPNTA